MTVKYCRYRIEFKKSKHSATVSYHRYRVVATLSEDLTYSDEKSSLLLVRRLINRNVTIVFSVTIDQNFRRSRAVATET